MSLTSDWHIHSRNSCDDACMDMAELVRSARQRGLECYGVSDHLNTPFNLPDIARSREEFLSLGPVPGFHFGIEASCVSQWEIDEIAKGRQDDPVWGIRKGGPAQGPLAIGITREDMARYAFEYVIGAVHWPMFVPMERDAIIRDYHRQNMFLATHPLVTIVGHPWYWGGKGWQDARGIYPAEPWFDDFGHIPASMHDEFAATAVEHRKVVEINICAILMNPHYPERFVKQYLDYLAGLKGRGVRLSLGSDCHSSTYAIKLDAVADLLASVGIGDADLWRLSGDRACRPPREKNSIKGVDRPGVIWDI